MAQCNKHPLTPDHISKLAALVDEKIGALIGDAALKNKVADLADWYGLRSVVALMQANGSAPLDKPAPKPRGPRAAKPSVTQQPSVASGTEPAS